MSDSERERPQPHQLFRTFLSGLRPLGGYCVGCLGQLYDAPTQEIEGYLGSIGLHGRHAECANCGERKDTFRDNPYL